MIDVRRIENKTFDEERALYGSEEIEAVKCSFDGPADGESAFKECRDIAAKECYFNLRYPFWHDRGLVISNCKMTENCRAALWYSQHITITDTLMHGIKALRECADVRLKNCDIVSPEFGWSVKSIKIVDCSAVSEYFLMRSSDIEAEKLKFSGKYSFQYIENAVFDNCEFDTKDAFWHAHNVTVKNSVVKGEYLGWYSENLTLENCLITGTQPLCYCKGLKLINCRMENTDLCFEKSDVNADITTKVESIKNPASGNINVAGVGEVIMDDKNAKGKITVKGSCSSNCA